MTRLFIRRVSFPPPAMKIASVLERAGYIGSCTRGYARAPGTQHESEMAAAM
jgi:hypothetical protein